MAEHAIKFTPHLLRKFIVCPPYMLHSVYASIRNGIITFLPGGWTTHFLCLAELGHPAQVFGRSNGFDSKRVKVKLRRVSLNKLETKNHDGSRREKAFMPFTGRGMFRGVQAWGRKSGSSGRKSVAILVGVLR